MNRDPFHLLDIYQYGQDVVAFVQGMNRTSFAADSKTQRAVLYSITVMGEATKRLSTELRSQNPQIPWKAIAGMRDKVIHQYFGVNLQVLWDTVQQDLPTLQPVIAQMLNDLSNSES